MRVEITRNWVLASAISIFPNCFRKFCNRSQLEQPFSSNFSISNCNQLKLAYEFEQQFELEFEFEQQFELEQLLLLRSAHARRHLWEPSDTGIGTSFQVEGPLFWRDFWNGLASKNLQNLIKNELETKSTKHVENVLNSIPLDLQETRFRTEGLSKITKTRGGDKSKTIQKQCFEIKSTSMKNRPQNSTKNDA